MRICHKQQNTKGKYLPEKFQKEMCVMSSLTNITFIPSPGKGAQTEQRASKD
jgi:hypothetical protein